MQAAKCTVDNQSTLWYNIISRMKGGEKVKGCRVSEVERLGRSVFCEDCEEHCQWKPRPCIICGEQKTEFHLGLWMCKRCERSVARGFER